MAQKTFQIALILSVPADDYESALDEADQIADDISIDAGVGVQAIRDYEHDNEDQRVLYLPAVEEDDSDGEEDGEED